MLGLWRPNQELFVDTLYFADQEEDLALELAVVDHNVERVYRLPSDATELVAPVAVFVSLKSGVELNDALKQLAWPLYHWQTRLIAALGGEPAAIFALEDPPAEFPHFGIYKEFVNSYMEIKGKIQKKSLITDLPSKRFVRCWWEESVELLEYVEYLWGALERFPMVGPHLSKVRDGVGGLRSLLKDYASLNVIEKHLILSGFAYGMAKMAIERNENDVALLLTHRSIDLSAQAVGLTESLVICGREGLNYASYLGDRAPPSLIKTIDYLQKSNFLLLKEGDQYQLERINNARNQLLLTHSAYAIGTDEIKHYHSCAYDINKELVIHTQLWRKGLKAVTGLTAIGMESFYEIHDFDSMFVTKKPTDILKEYDM